MLAARRDERSPREQERALERLKEGQLAFKARSDESVRPALSMTLGRQAGLVQKEVLAALRDARSQLGQERARERLQEENLAFKAKSDELTRRVLSMMLGGQVDLV